MGIMGNGNIAAVTLFYDEHFKKSSNKSNNSPLIMNAMKRTESILIEDDHMELPESPHNDEEMKEYHSMINPSPMAVSIEQATQTQLNLIGKKTKSKRKRKKKKHKEEIIEPPPGSPPIEIGKLQTAEIQISDDELNPEPEPGAIQCNDANGDDNEN